LAGNLDRVTTCVLTALTTIGASHQKQILRIAGALIGGFGIGMGAQVFILPYIDSIAGFTGPVHSRNRRRGMDRNLDSAVSLTWRAGCRRVLPDQLAGIRVSNLARRLKVIASSAYCWGCS